MFKKYGLDKNANFQTFIADIYTNTKVGESCLLLDRFVNLIAALDGSYKTADALAS